MLGLPAVQKTPALEHDPEDLHGFDERIRVQEMLGRHEVISTNGVPTRDTRYVSVAGMFHRAVRRSACPSRRRSSCKLDAAGSPIRPEAAMQAFTPAPNHASGGEVNQ